MDPREERAFLEVGRRRKLLARQLESIATIKAQREGRSVVEVLAGVLPPATIATIQEELKTLAFPCNECGETDWRDPSVPASGLCEACAPQAEEAAPAPVVGSDTVIQQPAGAAPRARQTPPPKEVAEAPSMPPTEPGVEEDLGDFIVREASLDLPAFLERHGGVFLFREVRGGPPRIRQLALGGEATDELPVSIERDASGAHVLVAGEGAVFLDSRRLAPGERVRLEEGWSLRVGPELVFTAFTPRGFFRFLGFRRRLERARG